MLKKILFILQKSVYGLEYKLVTWDCFKAIHKRRLKSLPSSLHHKPHLRLVLLTPEAGEATHWCFCSLDVTKMFNLNKAKKKKNHETKNKFAVKKKKYALLSRFYFKTFIQASLWFQAPQPKGIKQYWSLMAWKVAFWIKAHPATKGEGWASATNLKIPFLILDFENTKITSRLQYFQIT